MRPQLAEKTKQEVIRLWLSGLARDNIAYRLNISSGSVNNIVDKWKEDLDKPEADALRELAKSIHASGLSPAQYAAGVRLTNILTKNGVSADQAEQFVSTTYKKCQNLGITPHKAVSHIGDLTEFSDKIRLPEIEQYIKQKTREKEELDKQILEKEEKVSSLRLEVEDLKGRLERTFEEQRKAGEDFELFIKGKKELEKLHVPITDVPKFARSVKAFEDCGYRLDWIIAKTEEMFDFDLKRKQLNVAIYESDKKYNNLRQLNAYLQYQVNLHLERLPIYRMLENHGLGHWELETLLSAVLDISVSNGVPYWLAVNKFFNDIRTQYNSKLGFESKIEDLKLDIQIISEEKGKRLEDLEYLPSVYLIVNQLYSLGLKGNDILQLGRIYNTILTKNYSMEDLATAVTKLVDTMRSVANKSGGFQNDKLAEILSNVRAELSQIDFTT